MRALGKENVEEKIFVRHLTRHILALPQNYHFSEQKVLTYLSWTLTLLLFTREHDVRLQVVPAPCAHGSGVGAGKRGDHVQGVRAALLKERAKSDTLKEKSNFYVEQEQTLFKDLPRLTKKMWHRKS